MISAYKNESSMKREQKEITQNKERGIQIAAKVLILVPLITFIVFLLLIPATPRNGQAILFALVVFLITIGLVMSIAGTVMAIKQRMTAFIVIGVITLIHILILCFLFIFIWGVFQGMHFIMSGAGFVFLLALVALASPIGLMVFMGYRFKLQAAEKAEPFFEFLTRPVRELSARRHDSHIDLLNETNMVVGPRPSADTYYDSKARIKFENAEVFSNSEM